MEKNQCHSKLACTILKSYVLFGTYSNFDNRDKAKVRNNRLNSCQHPRFYKCFKHFIEVKIWSFLQNILYNCAWLDMPSNHICLPKTIQKIDKSIGKRIGKITRLNLQSFLFHLYYFSKRNLQSCIWSTPKQRMHDHWFPFPKFILMLLNCLQIYLCRKLPLCQKYSINSLYLRGPH